MVGRPQLWESNGPLQSLRLQIISGQHLQFKRLGLFKRYISICIYTETGTAAARSTNWCGPPYEVELWTTEWEWRLGTLDGGRAVVDQTVPLAKG